MLHRGLRKSSLPFNHPCLPKLPRRIPLPLIKCCSGQSEPHRWHPASPTPGLFFLKHQDSVRTAKLLIKEFLEDLRKDRTPVMGLIALKHRVTPSLVALQWGMTKGASVEVKSVNEKRMVENFEVLDLKLDGEDVSKIDKMQEFKFIKAESTLVKLAAHTRRSKIFGMMKHEPFTTTLYGKVAN